MKFFLCLKVLKGVNPVYVMLAILALFVIIYIIISVPFFTDNSEPALTKPVSSPPFFHLQLTTNEPFISSMAQDRRIAFVAEQRQKLEVKS